MLCHPRDVFLSQHQEINFDIGVGCVGVMGGCAATGSVLPDVRFSVWQSEDIVTELRDGGVEVIDGYAATERAQMYSSARIVFFPMGPEVRASLIFYDIESALAHIDLTQTARSLLCSGKMSVSSL